MHEGDLSSGTSSITKPIIAYDKDGKDYTLEIPENAVGRPITTFEIKSKPESSLTVKVPAVIAGFKKEVAKLKVEIPKEGKVDVNKEIDFIIQKAILTSIERTSETSAILKFDLNTGSDENISIIDIGLYNDKIKKSETVIKGDEAIVTLTFDNDLEAIELSFSYPRYNVEGNWEIELGDEK